MLSYPVSVLVDSTFLGDLRLADLGDLKLSDIGDLRLADLRGVTSPRGLLPGEVAAATTVAVVVVSAGPLSVAGRCRVSPHTVLGSVDDL